MQPGHETVWDESRLVNRTAQFRAELDGRIDKERARFAKLARGIAPRLCPICDYYGSFGPFGAALRYDARCPSCASLERHRLVWLMICRHGILTKQHSVLHFAAESVLRKRVQTLVGRYETAELRESARPDHLVNIEAIDLPDESYDRAICNHVLEHVDDRKALAELYRILRPGGIAVLTTPIIEGWAETYENPAVTGKSERLLHFAQSDHVRIFGRDLRDRIRAAGFALDEMVAKEPDVHRYGLMRGETVFLATKLEA
jgi:SAM-dependent methyltransferase